MTETRARARPGDAVLELGERWPAPGRRHGRRKSRSPPSSGSDTGSSADFPRGPETPPSDRQALLDQFMSSLQAREGPTYFTYRIFLDYLLRPPSPGGVLGVGFAETFDRVAARLLEISGGRVYLADGRAYVREALEPDFPELKVFRVGIDDMFVRSEAYPGIWVETRRFADLHSLSRMRRELQRTGVSQGYKAVDVVTALLGLEATVR